VKRVISSRKNSPNKINASIVYSLFLNLKRMKSFLDGWWSRLYGETGKKEKEPVIKKPIYSSPHNLSNTKLFSNRSKEKERKKKTKNKLKKKNKILNKIRSKTSRLPWVNKVLYKMNKISLKNRRKLLLLPIKIRFKLIFNIIRYKIMFLILPHPLAPLTREIQ